MYEKERQLLYEAHLTLEKYGLVAYTSGNVSLRIDDQVLIKPSGVPYSSLKSSDMVLVDLDGRIMGGNMKPSIDTAAHLYLYRNIDWTKAIIHTHSTFATTFAVCETSIPVLSTAHADVFGEKIPITEYAPVGSEAIGEAVLKVIGKSGTVLLRKHGAMILGTSLEDVLKKAVFLEEVAKISYFALMKQQVIPLDISEINKLHQQYHTKYGQ